MTAAQHSDNSHLTVWDLYAQYWDNGTWERPEHRVAPGRHRLPVARSVPLATAAYIATILTIAAVVLLIRGT